MKKMSKSLDFDEQFNTELYQEELKKALKRIDDLANNASKYIETNTREKKNLWNYCGETDEYTDTATVLRIITRKPSSLTLEIINALLNDRVLSFDAIERLKEFLWENEYAGNEM